MITVIDKNGEEFVVNSGSMLPDLPRHGRYDVDVVAYRNHEWVILPMSRLRVGDWFRKLNDQIDSTRVFLVTRPPQVNHHMANFYLGTRERDPDILVGGLRVSDLKSLYETQGLPALTKRGIPFSPTYARISYESL